MQEKSVFTPKHKVSGLKISSHFKGLKKQLCALDITWQPIRGDLITHAKRRSHEVIHLRVRHYLVTYVFIITMFLIILPILC